MTQGSNRPNRLWQLLGGIGLATLVAILALLWDISESINQRINERQASNTQFAIQATQIAKLDIQNELNAEQNRLLASQATNEASRATIEAQLRTPIVESNGDFAITATALVMQSTQIAATRQAIEDNRNQIESTQTALADSIEELSFDVYADRPWNDTGLNIETGDSVQIIYVTGEWTDYVGIKSPFDGNGDPGYICADVQEASTCAEPLPEAPKGALIARIGSERPIFIGNEASFMVTNTGLLQLGMNDSTSRNDLSDNEGFITVRIIVTDAQ
jgi:hypothetical protein